MNKVSLLFCAVLLAKIIGVTCVRAQDVVANGGLVAATNNTDWIISGSAEASEYNGDRSSDGDGWCGKMLAGNVSVTNGTIYQVVNVTPGTPYTFIYDYAKNGSSPKIYVDVFAGAVTASNYGSHPVGSGGLFSITNTASTTIPSYLSQTAVFTPAASQITIRFSDALNSTSAGTDGFVDNVRLIKGLITWAGTAAASTWNTTPGNTVWLRDTSSVAVPYANGNYVKFGGFAPTNVVQIPGAVSPSTVLVDNPATDATNAVTLMGNGVIGGATTALIKRGTGTLTINTTNTFRGPVAIAGTVVINSLKNADGTASSLGAPATPANGTIKLGLNGTAGTLVYSGTGDASDRIIDLTGASSGTPGGATLNHQGTGLLKFTSDFQASVSGSGTTTKTLTLNNTPSGPGEIAGAIVDGYLDVGGTGTTGVKKTALVMVGTGTWTLSGTNTYTGGTTVSSGTLRLGDGVSRNGEVAGSITDNATLEFATAANQTYPGVISGGGALVKSGAATLTFLGTNTYSGTTTVSGGTLAVSGVLGGPVVIQLGGALRVGTAGSVGAFTLGNSLEMGGSVVMRISRTAGVAAGDKIQGMTLVNYGGTLTVTNITSDGTPLIAGNRFRLFAAASYSGAFAATNLPPLPAGLAWMWTPDTGELSVIDPSNLPTGDYAFYVSTNGNDVTGDGSLANPWRTVQQARDYIRNTGLNLGMTGDIMVYLRGGRYQLDQTITFTAADSADNGHFIIYKSYPGEQAQLSGGKRVTGWTPVPGKPYWVAPVSTNAGFADYFRQLYVNGIREERAHSDWVKNVGVFDDPATFQPVDGVTFNSSDFKHYSQVTDLRMFRIGIFKVDEFPVTRITTNGSTGLIQVALQQPYCQTRYNYGNGASDPNSLENANQWMVIQAMEELDEAGEWYLDRTTQQVYYYPYSFEDMNTAEVYVPVVETLLSLTGDSTARKVQNLRFENLLFEHGNWFFPRDYFIGGTQAEILMPPEPPDAISPANGAPYAFEVPGQIKLNNTKGVQFVGNTMRHLASVGIHLFNGARDTLIQGNYFYDLTAAAVLGGRWGGDAPIPNQETCTNTVVANNVIRMIGLDFMAATAIDNFWHYGFQARHNDLADSQYMGFHQRTAALTIVNSAGTGGTVASFNRITLANNGARYGVGDGGFIYSFGVWPDTTIQGNDVNFVDSATDSAPGQMRGLMWDNNSYGLTGISNVLRNVKPGLTGYFLYTSLSGYKNLLADSFGDATVNNFSAVVNSNFSTFPLGSPPPAAQNIINNAGLEPAYTNLLQFVYSGINLAKAKPAWASSTNTSPGAAVDWNYSSVWQPLAGDTNQCWWAVDLGQPYVIRRIEIAANMSTNQPDARRNFRVEGDNDSNFSNPTVFSEQNAVAFAYRRTGIANSWVKYPNSPQAFRYVRVIKTAPGTLNFSEVRVFGYSLATNPPPLMPQLSGNSIHLSWPPDHLGWRLQGQTNTLQSGLGTNWVTLPGSASVTATNIQINSADPSMFFRLVYP
jgi:autotransporter-associated beta strand protein